MCVLKAQKGTDWREDRDDSLEYFPGIYFIFKNQGQSMGKKKGGGTTFIKKGFVLSVQVKIFMVSAVSFQICHGPLNTHLDIASFNYWNA